MQIALFLAQGVNDANTQLLSDKNLRNANGSNHSLRV